MNSVVTQLRGVLEQELSVYEQMYELARRKKKLLLEKFSTELHEIVSKEEVLIQLLLDLEPERIRCVEQITGKADANLDAAIEAVSEADGKSDLWLAGSKLREKVHEIKAANDENQNLLEQALELTQYSIRLITKAPGDVTYSSAGKRADGKRSGLSLIDRKA